MATSKPRSRKKTASADTSSNITAEERRRMITEAAYYLAEQRGFSGGSPEQDWIQAEREIDRVLQGTPLPPTDVSRGEVRSA